MKTGSIRVNNRIVEYHIRKHQRAKRVNIRINGSDSIRVTVPRWLPYVMGERFLYSKKDWLAKSFAGMENKNNSLAKLGRNDYLKYKERARGFLHHKLSQFNEYYGFRYNKVAVKDQRSRWGSCSSRGNLNFSYKVFFLPEYLADYIVVHELCHLKELRHSVKFWKLVERTIPDHKKRRKELKRYMF